jgi:hypothetical protein
MLIIFFDIKGIVQKKFVLAGRTVNSAYYCDVLWLLPDMCKDFAPKSGEKEMALASRQCTISHFLFHQAIFD